MGICMKAHYELRDPVDIEAKITLVATVGDFTALKAQLDRSDVTKNSWPLSEFYRMLTDVIKDADKHFYQNVTKPGVEK